jgi:hypothetical protein
VSVDDLQTLSRCASSDGTADDWDPWVEGTEGNRVNQTFTFVDEANDDFRLADTDTGAQGWGTPGFGSDIEGQARIEPHDIGCDAVDGVAVPPEITSPLTDSGEVGQSYTYTITASGTPPITYGVSGLPAGLSFDGINRINGIPESAGTASITLTATNTAGSDTETLVLTVNAPEPDNDGDGIPDSEDPDDDNDGMSDVDEGIAGTDAFDRDSKFELRALKLETGNWKLEFRSAAGRLYDVLYKDDLLDAVWLLLTSDVQGTGNLIEIVDPDPVARRFYRVKVRME